MTLIYTDNVMTKPYIFNFFVAYADTDAFGIMYHARYIEVAERARSLWSKGIVIPNDDAGFVVHELSIKYISPLLLGDEFIVETIPIKIGAASLVVEQKFVKCDKICAIMHVTVAYLGENMQPKAIPDGILSKLK